ncbi:kelch repeat-containing protein [Polaribacter sp. Asnod1-A03]|uniref:Kelch repeat-containing protein n=1 Tax=Polaribacter sp. Asnod1-A03 TaxID=3160581 RepID=UPI00386C73C5
MKSFFTISFLLFSIVCFSQKIKGTILDLETKTPIERAHIFFIDETIYTNQKGEFSFDLKGKKSIEFSVSHIKYETKKVIYTKSTKPLLVYLQEKQEILEGFNINANKKLQNAIQFKRLEDLPRGTYSFASVLNNNKIYVFGGDITNFHDQNREALSELSSSDEAAIMKFLTKPKFSNYINFIGDLQIYNITSKRWNIIQEKVLERAYYNAVSYKDTVFLIGGKKLSKKKTRELLANDIELVSLKDLSITKDQTNPHQAVNFGSVLHDDKILVFGGSTKQLKNGKILYSDDIHLYDIKTGYWYLLTKMPKAKEVTGIIFGDKLYFFGGFNKKNLTDIESYDLKTGRWKKEGNLFKGMKNPAITKDKEFIYLNENGKIITFEPKTRELKEFTIDLNLKDAKMHFFNENLYLIGGYHYINEYRKYPSKGFFTIEAAEFFKTEPINTKTL